MDWPKQARWDRLQIIHVLGIETPSVSGPKSGIVAWRLTGQKIDGCVINVDLDPVFAGMYEARDDETIRRVPEHAGALPIHKDNSRLANRRIKQGVDPRGVRRP
jgi:hypothetical protein